MSGNCNNIFLLSPPTNCCPDGTNRLMKRKIYSLVTILVLLHLVPVLQGCPRCGEAQTVEALAEQVNVNAFSITNGGNYSIEEPFDPQRFGFFISMILNDSLQWYASKGSMINHAIALQPCEDFYVIMLGHIDSVEIWRLEEQERVDITDQFLVEQSKGELYVPIQEWLSRQDVQNLRLIAKDVAKEASQEMIVRTHLDDGRIFADTLSLQFK